MGRRLRGRGHKCSQAMSDRLQHGFRNQSAKSQPLLIEGMARPSPGWPTTRTVRNTWEERHGNIGPIGQPRISMLPQHPDSTDGLHPLPIARSIFPHTLAPFFNRMGPR